MGEKYRLVIPCAGTGSRLGSLTSKVNKALVSVANRPGITHLIDKIPANVEIVVALGYKSETVRDFLALAYPERKFIFVDVDPYEGKGSGLGYTMLRCREELQCPFIFCSNDTIVEEAPPAPDFNWMGYADSGDTANYRSVRIRNGLVSELCSKGAYGDVKPYIGLCGVKDYALFWEAMSDPAMELEIGESFGLRKLIEKGITPIRFTWHDTGNVENLSRTRELLGKSDSPNILEKEEEAIWFVGDKVMKFSTDKEFIRKRVERAGMLYPYVPQITGHKPNIYAYRKVEGEIFSANARLGDFAYLLEWLDGFWQKKELDTEKKAEFREVCRDFYKAKTLKRVGQFFERFEQMDAAETINGQKIPKISELLAQVDWDWVCDGVPSRIHGDLHFENILINHNQKAPFTLLDWRQDFGGLMEYGDVYYDLAKLNHGLIISHELIGRKLFSVSRKVNNVEFDFLRKQNLVECEEYFRDYVTKRGYDYRKVRFLTYLIYLNIAALHHYPYSLLLFYLGKSGIHRMLREG